MRAFSPAGHVQLEGFKPCFYFRPIRQFKAQSHYFKPRVWIWEKRKIAFFACFLFCSTILYLPKNLFTCAHTHWCWFSFILYIISFYISCRLHADNLSMVWHLHVNYLSLVCQLLVGQIFIKSIYLSTTRTYNGGEISRKWGRIAIKKTGFGSKALIKLILANRNQVRTRSRGLGNLNFTSAH